METLGFEGRVVVVTGAGRGIGRGHARLLAARGARVVVNDLGGSIGGSGTDAGPAAEVVAEITAAGGEAVADTGDVSDPGAAAAMIATAVERFGRIDALVNNAGIVRWAGPAEADADNLARHLAVHVAGSFNTTVAAWPHFVEQGAGRIVMTTSAGTFGLPHNLGYATAKGGIIGMVRSLAVAGRRHGIAVNAVAPAAYTRMAGVPGQEPDPTDPLVAGMDPDLVAPMVAFLAHPDGPVSGVVYAAGAGRFSRIFLGSTPGLLVTGRAPTPEDVATHWAEINDTAGFTVPADLMDWSAGFTAHLLADPPTEET
jgi:short-subunit dehydrogenase